MRNSILRSCRAAPSKRRVLQPRHLHQNAVSALALDHRLDSAEPVDAALYDLDRLLDGLADALGDRGLRNRETDQPAAGIGNLQTALAAGASKPPSGRRQLPQLG